MQMSQEGLRRTLLYDLLQRFPQFAPVGFPNRLETYLIFGDYVAFKEPWTWTELRQTFRRIVKKVNESQRITFFIDGLDEFFGKATDLIDFLRGLLGSDVKICVSSRPWNVFEDAFGSGPNLRLEDLTHSDIKYYIESKLSANPGFEVLRQLDSAYASQLVQNVTDKSSGVFLWVSLVTESLLEGLSDGERLSDLRRRLDSLPPDLEDLFWKILNSLGAVHLKERPNYLKSLGPPLSNSQRCNFRLPTKTILSSRSRYRSHPFRHLKEN